MKKQVLLPLLLGGGLVLGSLTTSLANESSPINKELDGIVVTATKTEHTLVDVPEATVVITSEELEKQNAANALEALRWIPGLNISLGYGGHGGDRSMINGAHSGYTLVLVDGNRGHGRFSLSEIPVSTIERIEVVKGANSLLYGSDAMSGVINVITKKASSEFTASIRGTYEKNDEENSNTQEVTIGFGLGKIRQLYSYTRKDIEDSKYESDAFMAKFGIDLSDSLELDFDAKVNQFEMRNVESDKYEYHLNMDWDIDSNSSLQAKVFFRDYENETHVGGNRVGTNNDNPYNEEEIIYTRLLGSSHLVTAGYQHIGEDFDYAGPDENWSKDQDSNNLFIQDEITITDNLILVPALRVDFYSTWDDQVNPKLSMLWKASNSLRFRASWGTAFKSPSLKSLYRTTFHGRGKWGIWIVGNPDLQPEQSRTFRISAEQSFGKNFLASVALFRNDFDDMIKGGYTGKVMPDGFKEYSYKNVKEARTQGIEADMKYYLTDSILASLGYAYHDTEDKATGKPLYAVTEHRVTPMLRYDSAKFGFIAEIRADYQKYAKPTKEGDEDCFLLNASLSKRITDYVKLWVNADNILDEEAESGLAREGVKFTFGIQFDY